jgi:ketosteroid isomerase-like protein
MNDIRPEPARDPQDLERFLVERQNAGDIDGMLVLFEADAVVDVGGGRLLRGTDAIRGYYEELKAEGRRFQVGVQQPAVISGDLALTSTLSPNGSVTAEVARRQPDGTWRWVIDRYEIARHQRVPATAGRPVASDPRNDFG